MGFVGYCIGHKDEGPSKLVKCKEHRGSGGFKTWSQGDRGQVIALGSHVGFQKKGKYLVNKLITVNLLAINQVIKISQAILHAPSET